MAYNGSGTFSALSSFTSGTTISSSAMNALIADIASGLSNAVCKDGQSSITGQIAVSAGTVSAPGLAFSGDTNCGMYRIAADNIGFAAAGAKVLDISATGLGVTGTTLSGDGTVSLPGIGFTGDTDTGLYRIGANNIGVTCAGAKVLDVSATGLGVTGTITTNSVAVDAFASGTLMLFQQTSAPTGWTKQTTHNDKALRVVSGSASSGGTSAFSTVFGLTTTNSYTLTTTDIPSHSHNSGTLTGPLPDHTHQASAVVTAASTGTTASDTSVNPVVRTISATTITSGNPSGATVQLNGGSTGSTGSGGGHSHAIELRVQYVDLIIAAKA